MASGYICTTLSPHIMVFGQFITLWNQTNNNDERIQAQHYLHIHALNPSSA